MQYSTGYAWFPQTKMAHFSGSPCIRQGLLPGFIKNHFVTQSMFESISQLTSRGVLFNRM